MSEPRTRLDQLLVQQGHCQSRHQAQQWIAQGLVMHNGQTLTKPAQKLMPDATLTVEGFPWVSRAALKLLAAIPYIESDILGAVALDIGASTGGFTQVLLEHGAVKIYTVDVGHGQLHHSLLDEPRIIALERTNIRHVTTVDIPDPIDLIVCDVSFISLTLALPAALALAAPQAGLVALIKPQFEVGKKRLPKDGVVKEPSLRAEICEDIKQWIDAQAGWHVEQIIDSPIEGANGNHEFLCIARKE